MMKFGKKSTFILSLLLALAVSCFMFACNRSGAGGGEQGEEFVFEVQPEITVPYGDYCTVPEITANDRDGNLYFPTSSVTDSEGNAVIVENGRFFVSSMSGYTIKYSVKYKDETHEKTTAVIVKDLVSPEMELPYAYKVVFDGESVIIPSVTYTDDIDEQDDITLTVSVTKGDETVEVTDNTFVASAGVYLINYSAEDKSGNKTDKSITVKAVQKESGNVSYFNREFGAEASSVRKSGAGITSLTQQTDIVLPGDESALRVYSQDRVRSDAKAIFLDTPVIKDISEYKYLYYWVYNNSDERIRVCYNNIYDACWINPETWTRVVLTNDGTTFKTPSGAEVFEASGASVTDISGFKIIIELAANADKPIVTTDVYFGALKVAKDGELPTIQMNFEPVYFAGGGNEIDLTGSVNVSGITGGTKKIYVEHGGNKSEITGNSYAFADCGAYKFTCEVYDEGGVLAAKEESEVSVIEKESDNITYWNTAYGAQISGVRHNAGVTTAEISEDFTLPGEDYSLRVYSLRAQRQAARLIYIDTPAIKDVSEYQYIYYWVYNNSECDIRLSYNSIYDSYVVSPGAWKRVVLTKNGTNFKTPSAQGADVFNPAGGTQFPATVNDISKFMLMIQSRPNTGEEPQTTDVYFSSMRVAKANELPTIEKTFADSYEIGNEIDMTATVSGAGSDYTLKIYSKTDTALTEFTDDKFVPNARGAYTFVYKAYIGDSLADVFEKTISVEDTVFIPFNTNIESSAIGGNASGKGSNSSKTYGNEKYSFYCYGNGGSWPYISVQSPLITNLNVKDDNGEYKYNYLYCYVYTNIAGNKVYYNSVDTATIALTQSQWTPVVAERVGDDFKINGISIFKGDSNWPSTVTDTAKFVIRFTVAGASSDSSSFYISAVRVSKEAPPAAVN